jgi:hypothetical protein
MSVARVGHTATLLPNGLVLVAGGGSASAEVYDPDTGDWNATGIMSSARSYHTATLLPDGRVLVAGGTGDSGQSLASAEIYNPNTSTWSAARSMHVARSYHTATLLQEGWVLVVGGQYEDVSGSLESAELYNPATDVWSVTASMSDARQRHTATMLSDGRVLVAGGQEGAWWGILTSAELYNPANNVWSTAGSTSTARSYHTATLLPDGRVLVAGGALTAGTSSASSCEIGGLMPANRFTGTLTLPAGWVNTTQANAQFAGTTSTAPLNAGRLIVDGGAGAWVNATNGATQSLVWPTGADGANKPVALELRDVNDVVAVVVTGTVSVDKAPPTSSMTPLASNSPRPFALAWSGSDALSGLVSYDVQVRAESYGEWTDLLVATPLTSTIYPAPNPGIYYFRVRARDVAGNVEDWPDFYDASNGAEYSVSINDGALYTNQVTVTLSIGARPGTARMQISNDAGFANAPVQPYRSRTAWQITKYGDYVIPRLVYVRYLDGGNRVLDTKQDDIILDLNPPSGSVVVTPGLESLTSAVPPQGRPETQDSSAAGGAHTVCLPLVLKCYPPPTSGPANVTLRLDAKDDVSGVGSMIISNRPDFLCADWESYATRKHWYVPAGTTTVYVKFRDNAGNVSSVASATITR